MSKLKVLEDKKIKMTQDLIFFFNFHLFFFWGGGEGLENIVAKGYQHFLLFTECFKNCLPHGHLKLRLYCKEITSCFVTRNDHVDLIKTYNSYCSPLLVEV